MQAPDARPPYVVFEPRQVEDRNASIEAGHYVGKDIVFAIVTPQGSRDKLEKEAEVWLQDIANAAREDRFPGEWVDAYRRSYAAYKEGREITAEGTPIVTWPPLSPSQQKLILDANIRTVEDLANANESTLTLIGMGARALKQQAASWLESSQGIGKVAAANAALIIENEALKTQVTTQSETIKELRAEIKTLKKD